MENHHVHHQRAQWWRDQQLGWQAYIASSLLSGGFLSAQLSSRGYSSLSIGSFLFFFAAWVSCQAGVTVVSCLAPFPRQRSSLTESLPVIFIRCRCYSWSFRKQTCRYCRIWVINAAWPTFSHSVICRLWLLSLLFTGAWTTQPRTRTMGYF